jgi:hypothetical protein
MTTHCQPLPRPLAEEMLQVVARAICDRPGDSSAQRDSRTRQMVHSTMGFEPRDGLEYMLSIMAFGHFQVILDSMRDVFQGQTDAMKVKTKTTIVALDRAMLEMIKELRVVRRRPMARSAEDARREETRPMPAAAAPMAAPVDVPMDVPMAAPMAAPVDVPMDVPMAAPMDAPVDVPLDVPMDVPMDAPVGAQVSVSVAVAAVPVMDAARDAAARPGSATPAGSRPAKIAPAYIGLARSAPPIPDFAAIKKALLGLGAPGPGEVGTHTTPAVSGPGQVGPLQASARVATAAEVQFSAADINNRTSPPSDEGSFDEPIAAFESVFAATMETLADTRELAVAKAEAASGD